MAEVREELKTREEQMEEQVLLRALLEVNVQEFLKDDFPLLESIITDPFPRVERPASDNDALESKGADQCRVNSVQPTPYFLKKIFEIFDDPQAAVDSFGG